jgi:hypothetical protein
LMSAARFVTMPKSRPTPAAGRGTPSRASTAGVVVPSAVPPNQDLRPQRLEAERPFRPCAVHGGLPSRVVSVVGLSRDRVLRGLSYLLVRWRPPSGQDPV